MSRFLNINDAPEEVNTNLELALPNVQVRRTENDTEEEVVVISPRSFAQATNGRRRNRGLIRNGDVAYERDHTGTSFSNAGVSHMAYWGEQSHEKRDLGQCSGLTPSPPPPPPPTEPTFSCPICMGPFEEETATKCGHIFCKFCIKRAIAFQAKCPTCRNTISINDIFRVYLPTARCSRGL